MMADLYLDMDTWSTTVEGGYLREVTDWTQEMKQRIGIALKTHTGEWALDTARGLPYIDEIMIKGPDLNQVASRIRAYLMTVEGVIGVPELKLELDNGTRELSITVTVETPADIVGPFNVTLP